MSLLLSVADFFCFYFSEYLSCFIVDYDTKRLVICRHAR